MPTLSERKHRLSEVKETLRSLTAIKLHYQHVLETRERALPQAEKNVASAVEEFERLKLSIHSAPEQISQCERGIRQAEQEMGTLANTKAQQLIKLKMLVAKLESELL